MALQVWLPLDGSIENKGLSNATTRLVTGATSFVDGRMGKALSCNGTSFWSVSAITLGDNVSICWWAKTTDTAAMFGC